MIKNKYKYIGQTFDRLTVYAGDDEKSKATGKIYYKCRCICGNEVSVLGASLVSGNTKSCGCLQKEKASEIIATRDYHKRNKIEYDKELNCLRVYFNNCDDSFLCDEEDKDIAEKYGWYKDNYGYVRTIITCEDGKRHNKRFHRLVMERKYGDLVKGKMIDHKSHDKSDNRKEINLRICDRSQNMTNKRPTSKTGVKHMSYIKAKDVYVVQIKGIPTKSFYFYWDGVNYINNYYKNHTTEFSYRPDEDYLNRDIIRPFIKANGDEFLKTIKPFAILDEDKFYR